MRAAEVRNEAMASVKRAIKGKRALEVQEDQRRLEAWAPVMSAAAV